MIYHSKRLFTHVSSAVPSSLCTATQHLTAVSRRTSVFSPSFLFPGPFLDLRGLGGMAPSHRRLPGVKGHRKSMLWGRGRAPWKARERPEGGAQAHRPCLRPDASRYLSVLQVLHVERASAASPSLHADVPGAPFAERPAPSPFEELAHKESTLANAPSLEFFFASGTGRRDSYSRTS